MKALFITSAIFLCARIFSQEWMWAKNYGEYWEDYGVSIQVDEVNNIYVTGVDMKMSCGQCNNYYKEWFYKFDGSGNLLWKKLLSKSGSRIVTDSNGYSYMSAAGYLMKYDPNGNLIWTSSDTTIGIISMALHPEGGIVVSAAAAGEKGYIARFDENGNELWKHTRNYYGYNYGNVFVDRYGNIYFSGGYKPDTSSTYRGIMTRLHSDGSLSMIYPTPVGSRSCVADLEGNVYLIEDNDSLMKFDIQGAKQWQKKIDATYLQQRPILLCDKENNLFITGSYSHRLKIDNVELTNTGNIYAFVFKLFSNGTIDWYTTSGGVNQASPYAVTIKENNLYLTGSISGTMSFGSSTVHPESELCDLLLAKLNCERTIGLKENTPDQSDFIISPNPSSGEFYISGNALGDCNMQIHNLAGQLILSQKINLINQPHRIGSIPKGVYFITLKSSGQIRTKKLLVE